MKLPHLAPVRFAKTILSLDENSAIVQCTFPHKPTLGMLFESAAQSSASFSQEESQLGFVVMVKDTELLMQTEALEVMVQIEKKVAMSNICEFSFNVCSMNEEKLYAKGTITISLQV